jgi:DNA replication factor GINS
MDIDELRTVQTKERQKDSLQHLRDSFYEDVAAYIQELKRRRQEAADAASDPFSDPEVSQLTDEIETAEDVVEAVYERRVGKVVKLASFAAADMPVDEDGLTVQERDLFEDLVGRIGQNKDRVLDILAGEGDSGAASTPTGADPAGTAPGAEPTGDADSEPLPHETNEANASDSTPDHSEPAVGMGTEPSDTAPDVDDDQPAPAPEAPPDEPAEEFLGADPEADEEPLGEPPAGDPEPESRGRPDGGTTTDRTTVRITADVGRVLGMDDREYDLRSEDVVSLPEENADALLQREAAEEL